MHKPYKGLAPLCMCSSHNDMLNHGCTTDSQLFYNSVLITILCRLVLHILHLTLFSFFEVIPTIFQAIQN